MHSVIPSLLTFHLCLSAEPPIVIDARELQSCDAYGLAFLARVRDGTASVEGLSGHLLMRIRIEARRLSSDTHR